VATSTETTSGEAESTISAAVETTPNPMTAEGLYLDLMKRALTRTLSAKPRERQTLQPGRRTLRTAHALIKSVLAPAGLELVRVINTGPSDYLESGDAATNRVEDAETMLGTRQLDHMQAAIEDVVRRGVPGDLLEAGVWRGGMTIFMRAVLKVHRETTRRVWVVDSFAGLPKPDAAFDSFGWKRGDMSASLPNVKGNFARYGLLDEQVVFVKGFFSETLPTAPIQALSILRADADLYESTADILNNLYPKLSVGGYAIFDDYQNLKDCRRAIEDYRQAHGILEPIVTIDKRAAYWIKTSG
jgi:O-methyltransferase